MRLNEPPLNMRFPLQSIDNARMPPACLVGIVLHGLLSRLNVSQEQNPPVITATRQNITLGRKGESIHTFVVTMKRIRMTKAKIPVLHN